MKKVKITSLVTALACLVFTVVPFSGASAKSEKVINLKFANFMPPPAAQSKLCEEFIYELENRTNGRVKVRYFPGGSLLKSSAILKGIETGITDIGFSHIEYNPGRLPVMEAAELPLGYPTAWVANQIMNDFYNKFKPKEWDKVVPLWFHANGPSLVITKNPVRTLEDFKGLVIRAPGRMAEVISALGGIPSPTPIMETYDAISKNVIQGAFAAGESVRTFKFGETAKYVTMSWNVGPSYPFYVAINKKRYDSLPPDIKTILDKLSGEFRERFALMWESIDFNGMEYGKSKGVEYIELPKDEFDRWTKAVEPVIESYVASMVEKGYPESEVRGWIDYLKKRKDELLTKQKMLNIKSTTGPSEVR